MLKIWLKDLVSTRCRDGIVVETLRCNETGIVGIEYPAIVLEMSHIFASTRVHPLPPIFCGIRVAHPFSSFFVLSYYVS
jgi:hypothetical protein